MSHALGDNSDARTKITVLIPVYNEERNVRSAYNAVVKVFEELPAYELEILFTDNHSIDATPVELEKLAAEDTRVKVVRFARNFGFQRSVLTGYRLATGRAAIQLDCDLQDPPELILEFVRLWEAGHDVVVGVRRKRKENFLLQLGRRWFYWLVTAISDDDIIENAGDFRLVDRTVLDRLAKINDVQPYTRGLISSLAARQIGIPYDRNARQFGASKFPLRRLTGFAADGLVSHSLFPLRVAGFTGFFVFIGTLFLLAFYGVSWLIAGQDWPAGFATTTILILFSLALNAMFIGIVGEYVGRIYIQVRERPITIIERTINIPDDGER